MHTTIADVILTHMETLANQLAHMLPWVKHLNAEERADLLADLAQACAQARRTGEPQALIDVLEDWEETALLVGNEQLADRLQASKALHEYTSWETLRAHVPGEATP